MYKLHSVKDNRDKLVQKYVRGTSSFWLDVSGKGLA